MATSAQGPEVQIPEISQERVEQLACEIDKAGFAHIPGFLPAGILRRAQLFVFDAAHRFPGRYIHFDHSTEFRAAGLDLVVDSSSFRQLMHGLYEHAIEKPAEKQQYYQILRCLSGNSGQKHSLLFHYDSHIVTALIPIHIPDTGQTGDLLLYPNTRKIRKSYWLCVLEKALIKNPLAQMILKLCVGIRLFEPKRLKMIPGDLYLFWGYRSIHANAPCDPDKIRATALFHYSNPHEVDDGLRRRVNRSLNKFKRAGSAVS